MTDKSQWPTLEGRLKHPIETTERAIEQLKQIYPDAKADPEAVEAFVKDLDTGG